jgi:tetratricopeptide (TPR) repeat protein
MAGFTQTMTAQEYIDIAYTQLEKEDFEGALMSLNTGISSMPDSVSLYIFRSNVFDAYGLHDKAIDDFSKVIKISNDSIMKAHYYSSRGGLKHKTRDFEGAYNDLIIAISFDSTNLDALNNLAAVSKEIDRPEEAIEYLEKIIQIDSSYAAAYVNLGFTYQSAGKHELAIENFDMAIKYQPEEAFGYSNRAFSKLKTGDLKGAMADINRSLELYPTNSYAYKIRALIYIKENNSDKTCVDLRIASELGYTKQYGNEVDELLKKHCD